MKLESTIPNCSTGQISGLSRQILDKLLTQNKLVKVSHPLIQCEGLHNNPYLQPLAYKYLVRAVEHRNRVLVINSCLRTVMQQHMLRVQYLHGWCGIRAAAPPGQSGHNNGLSIDIQDSKRWRPYLQRVGWRYIGDFDPMHYDFAPKSAAQRSQLVNLSQLQILEFQKLWNAHNKSDRLVEDGIWGKKTANAVNNSPRQGFGKPTLLRKGDRSHEVMRLQYLLQQALGLTASTLKPDSHFGSATERAVREFQQRNGLAVDGIVGAETMRRLKK